MLGPKFIILNAF